MLAGRDEDDLQQKQNRSETDQRQNTKKECKKNSCAQRSKNIRKTHAYIPRQQKARERVCVRGVCTKQQKTHLKSRGVYSSSNTFKNLVASKHRTRDRVRENAFGGTIIKRLIRQSYEKQTYICSEKERQKYRAAIGCEDVFFFLLFTCTYTYTYTYI